MKSTEDFFESARTESTDRTKKAAYHSIEKVRDELKKVGTLVAFTPELGSKLNKVRVALRKFEKAVENYRDED